MMVDRSQLRRMIEKLENALSVLEAQQDARNDALDKDLDDECDYDVTNPLSAPTGETFSTAQLFTDSPPARIHEAPDIKPDTTRKMKDLFA